LTAFLMAKTLFIACAALMLAASLTLAADILPNPALTPDTAKRGPTVQAEAGLLVTSLRL
jgi:hypothetical protein